MYWTYMETISTWEYVLITFPFLCALWYSQMCAYASKHCKCSKPSATRINNVFKQLIQNTADTCSNESVFLFFHFLETTLKFLQSEKGMSNDEK